MKKLSAHSSDSTFRQDIGLIRKKVGLQVVSSLYAVTVTPTAQKLLSEKKFRNLAIYIIYIIYANAIVSTIVPLRDIFYRQK